MPEEGRVLCGCIEGIDFCQLSATCGKESFCQVILFDQFYIYGYKALKTTMPPSTANLGGIAKTKNLMANLEGRFDLAKSFLVSQSDPSFRIGITTRSNASGNQPPLILYLPLPKGRREYISGLFPVNNGQIMTRQGYSPSIGPDAQNGQIIAGQTYSLDYGGQYYLMEVDSLDPVVTIRPANRPGKRRLKSKVPSISIGLLSPSRRQAAQPKGVKNKVKTMCRHSEKQYYTSVNQLFIDFQVHQNDPKTYES